MRETICLRSSSACRARARVDLPLPSMPENVINIWTRRPLAAYRSCSLVARCLGHGADGGVLTEPARTDVVADELLQYLVCAAGNARHPHVSPEPADRRRRGIAGPAKHLQRLVGDLLCDARCHQLR